MSNLHPMLFNTEMVAAIREGRKTQTRRVITDRTSQGNYRASQMDLDQAWVDPGPSPAGNPGPYLKAPVLSRFGDVVERLYPRIWVGDRIWVRETWRYRGKTHSGRKGTGWRSESRVEFKDGTLRTVLGDHPAPPFKPPTEDRESIEYWKYTDAYWKKWRPSIHMPFWAHRIVLEVTQLRIQRIQDIRPFDIIDEGVRLTTDIGTQKSFERLWNGINAARGHGWTRNPWVWAYTFKVVRS